MTDFVKSYLTVTPSKAVFSVQVPNEKFLTIETTPDISREFIAHIRVVFDKKEFKINLNQLTNVFGLNSRTTMNAIFDRLSQEDMDAILNGYDFPTTLPTNKKLAMVYSSLLAGVLFVIWLSAQNTSAFEPLKIESLVQDQNLTSILTAFNAQTVSYLKASAMLFDLLRVSPIHRLLNLTVPWNNLWLEVLPPLDTDVASVEGSLVAINATIRLIPDVVEDVHRTVEEATATFSQFTATQTQRENNFLLKMTNSSNQAEARLRQINVQTRRDSEKLLASLTKSRDAINDQLRQTRQAGETSLINKTNSGVQTLVKRAQEIQNSINDLHNSAILNINQTLIKVNENLERITGQFDQLYTEERSRLQTQQQSIKMAIDRFEERQTQLTDKVREMENFQQRLVKTTDNCLIEYQESCKKSEGEHELTRRRNLFKHKQELNEHMFGLKKSIRSHVDDALKEVIIDHVRLHFNNKFEEHIKEVICGEIVDELTSEALDGIAAASRRSIHQLNQKYDEVTKAIDTSQTSAAMSQKNNETVARLMAQVRLLNGRVKELEITGRQS